MSKNRIFLMSMLSLSAMVAKGDSMVKMNVDNNHSHPIYINGKQADGSFNVGFNVPAHAKGIVIAQVKKYCVLQDQLFLAIAKNSVFEIQNALAAGADVNKPREGRTLLDWALQFNNADAAACLIAYGAR